MGNSSGSGQGLSSGGGNQNSPEFLPDIVVTAPSNSDDWIEGFFCGYLSAEGFGPMIGGCAGAEDWSISAGVGFSDRPVVIRFSGESEIPRVSVDAESITFNLRPGDFQAALERGREAAYSIADHIWNHAYPRLDYYNDR
mgnify:CR=1 FL=1